MLLQPNAFVHLRPQKVSWQNGFMANKQHYNT